MHRPRPSSQFPRRSSQATAAGQSALVSEPTAPEAGAGASFGPFRLLPAERLLERDGAPVELGGRALDILITLVRQAGEVVSKADLLARVWPDTVVVESSLRVHIANLRKVLGDGEDGARYVTNVAGRGYCFVAPIAQATEPQRRSSRPPAFQEQALRGLAHGLPARLSRMTGRDDTVRTVI